MFTRRKFILTTLPLVTASQAPAETSAETTAHKGTQFGWADALSLRNGVVEVVIVPSIGRIVQFRYLNTADSGPMWRDSQLDGKPVNANGDQWTNFGGDKTWPAPQSDWPQRWPRSWPPPVTFDQTPLEATQADSAVLLKSPVDPVSGLRFERKIQLHPMLPQMEVLTTYENVSGPAVPVSVWTITQLHHPVRMEIPLSKQSKFPNQWHPLSKNPPNVEVKDGLLTWKRYPEAAHKIGCDAQEMIWVGEKEQIHISHVRDPAAIYPDEGCSVEIYTNDKAKPYVELECLGPLITLQKGQKTSLKVAYRLSKSLDAAAATR